MDRARWSPADRPRARRSPHPRGQGRSRDIPRLARLGRLLDVGQGLGLSLDGDVFGLRSRCRRRHRVFWSGDPARGRRSPSRRSRDPGTCRYVLALVGDSTITSAAPVPASPPSRSPGVTRAARFFFAGAATGVSSILTAALVRFAALGEAGRFAGDFAFLVVAMRSSLPTVSHPGNNPERPQKNALRGTLARRRSINRCVPTTYNTTNRR